MKMTVEKNNQGSYRKMSLKCRGRRAKKKGYYHHIPKARVL